jgi:hypothetical protein
MSTSSRANRAYWRTIGIAASPSNPARNLARRGLPSRHKGRSDFAVLVSLPENLEVGHKLLANHGAERLHSERPCLPSVQDCYHCANRCLDMWNHSVDHATGSWLLEMADAWLQLAEFEGGAH